MAQGLGILNANDTAPVQNAEAVDISATDHAFSRATRGLWVGTGGTVIGTLRGESAVTTFAGVADGTLLPFAFISIQKTSTTASNMVGVW